MSQVLGRSDACITVMAKLNRERKNRGLSPVSEDASAYTKARARLPVELIDHLSERVRKMAHNMMPHEGKWKGLNVYLVDGFVLRAPDTLANQKAFPQPSSHSATSNGALPPEFAHASKYQFRHRRGLIFQSDRVAKIENSIMANPSSGRQINSPPAAGASRSMTNSGNYRTSSAISFTVLTMCSSTSPDHFVGSP